MKLKQKFVWGFLLLCVCGWGLSAIDTPRAEVISAARAGLESYLPLILSAGELSAGKVELGYGFAEYTVDPKSLLVDVETPLWEKARATGAWRFVILLDGKAVALLTVDRMDGTYQTVGIGATQLAGEVWTVANTYPQDSGFQHRFIRIFQAKADFMEVQKENEEPRYAPLIAGRIALQIEQVETTPHQRLYQSEIVEPLREIVLNAMTKEEVSTLMDVKER